MRLEIGHPDIGGPVAIEGTLSVPVTEQYTQFVASKRANLVEAVEKSRVLLEWYRESFRRSIGNAQWTTIPRPAAAMRGGTSLIDPLVGEEVGKIVRDALNEASSVSRVYEGKLKTATNLRANNDRRARNEAKKKEEGGGVRANDGANRCPSRNGANRCPSRSGGRNGEGVGVRSPCERSA